MTPDSERIKVARESYGSQKNVKFQVASDTDFPEGEYDLVICTSVLHWIDNKDAAFKRVFKSLKPGGRFAFTTMDNPTHSEVDLLTKMVELFGPQTVEATLGSLYWKSAADYKHLATSNGFEVTSLEVTEHVFTFPNTDACIHRLFLRGVSGKI